MIVDAIVCQILLLLCVSVAEADSASYVYGVTSTVVGCNFPQQKKLKRSSGLGFDARIFQYDFEDMSLGYDANFMASGYASRTLEYSIDGITDINFSGIVPDADASVPYEATLFGETLEVSNFVAEFTSYFGVTESGFYKFELDNTDDSVMFFIGGDSALECCTLASNFDFTSVNASSYNMFTGIHNAGAQSFYQYLEAYHFYPIRVVYANMASNYTMSLKIAYPDGTVQTKFDNGDFISPDGLSQTWDVRDCRSYSLSADSVTIVTSWTGSTASYSTYTPSTGDDAFTEYQYYPDPTTTVTTHYHGSTISSTVVTPTGAGTWTESIFYPEETVTSYVSWTGATTETSTTIIPENPEIPATIVIEIPGPITTTTHLWTGTETSSNTIYPVEGTNGTITVEILTPRKTVTSYVQWTGATTATSTTVIPENAEVPATVVIEVPDAITTTTLLWTGAETSSSTIYPADGQNGTVTVEVLIPRDVMASTTFWTGDFTSTYTTISPDNSNGTITVGVEIPRCTKTVTDFWSGSTTSYTTEYPSDFINEVIIHEYVPQSVISSGIVYVTTYWTGDFTSYSTVNPGYNNDTTTILVNIPQQTITETWSGTVTSTSFYCPFSGAASIPVVLVPSATSVSENCENCKSFLVSSSVAPYLGTSGIPSEPSESYGSKSTSVLLNEFSGSSSGGSTESSSPTPNIDIQYSNTGNKLTFLNLVLIASSLSFSLYIVI